MADEQQGSGATDRPSRPDQANVIRRARAEVADYTNPTPPTDKGETPLPTMEEWADLVSQRIEEAMRQGAFDNLPGRGKPLELCRDPYVPEDQQMANTLLRNNDLVPAWISERKAVLSAIERLRAKLTASAAFARQELASVQDGAGRDRLAQAWERWTLEWQVEMTALNKRILTLNLQQPVVHLEVYQLQLGDELARANAPRLP